MINTKEFYDSLIAKDLTFFTGVPDSTLKELCACISTGASERHVVAANEGNSVAIASGYSVATGKTGIVYMQNSGLGNIVNPLLSLADEKIYQIPMLFIIGYRGEPGVHDEPQHITQGELTLPLLETLRVPYFILEDDYEPQLNECLRIIKEEKKSVALVVKKGTFSKYPWSASESSISMTREKALSLIIDSLDENDFIVSTTGKCSREIFEIRESRKEGHGKDFLTVGSMGHTSSLGLGMSIGAAFNYSDVNAMQNNIEKKNIYCIDGDGSFIMHMGGVATAAVFGGDNYKYILIDNECHESVGGQPTISAKLDKSMILKGFGYQEVFEADNEVDLASCLELLKKSAKSALIIKTNANSREDLGRPTTSPQENKEKFQENIRG